MGKLRFAIIGCGRISRKHVEAIAASERAELVAVCDINSEKAKQYNLPYYTNYHKMLVNENINVVNILTPSGLHCKHTVDIVSRYRKHIIVEKPMALSVRDCTWMINVCKENDVRLFVVKQNRFNAPVMKLLEAVKEGRFGKFVMGTVRVRWMRKQEYYQDGWHGTKSMDGGIFYNQASHHIDLLLHIMGNVTEVKALTARRLVNIETEDTGAALLRFESGAIGVVEATTATRPCDLEGSISILGEKGTVEIAGFALNCLKTWKFANSSSEIGTTPIGSIDKGAGIPKNDLTPIESPLNAPTVEDLSRFNENPPNVYGYGHKKYIASVIDCILNNKHDNIVNGEDGRKSIEVINRIYEAATTNNLSKV